MDAEYGPQFMSLNLLIHIIYSCLLLEHARLML
jgi:hypothetical protein